jgi:hypothetical protein
VHSWWHETTQQFFIYLLTGLGFVPFGVVYAVLRVHQQNQWYVLALPLAGGLALASVIQFVTGALLMERNVSHAARHPKDVIAETQTLRAQ